MNPDAFLKDIRDRIAREELGQALRQLRQFLDNAPQLDEALQQELRELLSDLETQARGIPALRQEVESAISVLQSKDVVAGATITAGGNVHIGDKQVTQNAEKIYNIDKIDNANFP